MLKKFVYILIIILIFIFSAEIFSSFENKFSSLYKNILPSNPFYSFKDATGRFKANFQINEKDKSKLFLNLANDNINEEIKLINNGQKNLNNQIIEDYKNNLKDSLASAKKIKNEKEKDEVMSEIAKKALDNYLKIETSLSSSTTENQSLAKVAGIENADILEALKSVPDQKLNEIVNDISKSNSSLAQKISTITESEPNKSTPEVNPPINEVSDSNECLNLYNCKIGCGNNIINNCNDSSGSNLNKLNICLQSCLSLNGLNGCVVDKDCENYCFEKYNYNCQPEVYSQCVANCEEKYDKCELKL